MAGRTQLLERNIEIARHFMQRVIADPAGAPQHLTVIPLSLLAAAGDGNRLTAARIMLLAQLRAHGEYPRMKDLADAVGRDKFAVSKDVDALVSLGLVHKRRQGRVVSVAADPRAIILA